jgi:uncharacterized DUF497 family protein
MFGKHLVVYMSKVYILGMQGGLSQLDGFEWDEGNRDKSRLKHKVSNGECEEVFFNQPLIILDDPKHSQEEQRYAAHGMTDDGRRLHIIFTVRKNRFRVISARDMHRKEWKFYDS